MRRSARGASREAEGRESLQLDREAVRHWRLQAGFTREALSRQHVEIDGERVQISYAQLRRIEREGRAGPGTARILAALLGVELAQLRPRDPRAQPCGLPREVSVDFVGRRAELAAVLEVLQREGHVRIAASVEGLPGAGKTELALQVCGVCERSRAFRIFWLHAEQSDLTPQWAGPVAQHLGIEHPEERERARLALRKLESLGEPTLIVLDNVERWSASQPWPRPQGRHLRWLVTTRASQLGDRAFEHVEVPVLDEASARELFARIAGLDVCERPGFAELVQHGYTLAIELAAAFLGRFPEVDPAEYLKLLSRRKGGPARRRGARALAVSADAGERTGSALAAPAGLDSRPVAACGLLRTGPGAPGALGCLWSPAARVCETARFPRHSARLAWMEHAPPGACVCAERRSS